MIEKFLLEAVLFRSDKSRKEPLLGGIFLASVISVVMILPWVMTFLPGIFSWVIVLPLIALESSLPLRSEEED